jgi:hypothetical protein
MQAERRITCPCCGHLSITDTYDICGICGWEHDPVQEDNPDSSIGANRVSLREAQRNFRVLGASAEGYADSVREPGSDDQRDPEWKPIDDV